MTNLLNNWAATFGDLWAMDINRIAAYMPSDTQAAGAHERWLSQRLPRAAGGVALIPIHGVMTKRGGWFTLGTDAIGRTIDAALASDRIGSIVLDFDSPGGSVAGLPEFADKIYSVRGQKPIVSVVDPLMASAALWSGTAADQVVVTPSGDIGSHGVYSMHIDWSKALENDGIKVSMIHAGKFKVEGNPFEPLNDEARAEFQRSVDEAYSEFTSALARNRGKARSHVRDQFGQGRVLSASKAVEVGMADRVATLDEVLTKMGATRVELMQANAETDILHAAFFGVATEAGNKPSGRHPEALKRRRERELAK